jgi:opacity protein-like surface antigen
MSVRRLHLLTILILALGGMDALAQAEQTPVTQEQPPVKQELRSVDCDQNLSNAQAEFATGHFYSIPSILSGCLEGGKLSKDQLVAAYLILCQTYLIIDDPIAASDSYLKLLKADPEFVPNETDHPIDIVYLSKQYTATPIFTPHFRLGINTSFYRLIHSISTEPYGQISADAQKFGFQVGGGVDWNINDNFSLCIEGNLASLNFERRLTNGIDDDEIFVSGGQWWLDFPLYAKYSFVLNNTIRPFGYAGIAGSYLLSASSQFTFTDNKPTGAKLVSEGPSESVVSQRNRLALSMVIGAGIRYKIGKNFLYADVRYMGGLTNLANESTLYYQDPSSINPAQIGNPNNYLSPNATRYHYLSDLFSMDNVSLSFGFVKPLYDPRKVKRARTKGVAKSVEKEGGKKKK